MPTLYVTEQGSVVRYSAGSIVVTVTKDPDGSGPLPERSHQLIETEPHRLELIALVGRVHITSAAVQKCLEQGIAVAWFRRNGDFLGRLVPELSRTADLRLAQFDMVHDEAQSHFLARTFIEAKVHSAIGVLAGLRSNRKQQPELGQAIKELKGLLHLVKQSHCKGELMGFEGTAARRYFRGLKNGFSADISFTGRARRPPPDPANALLSFGYTILVNTLASLLEARGFDPYVGFLHAVRSGRPSLALDLVEEFRHSVVDRFALRICNRRQLRLEHFQEDLESGGVRLTRPGMRIFFRAWEAFMDANLPGIKESIATEDLLRRQTGRLAEHVRGREEYKPIMLRYS